MGFPEVVGDVAVSGEQVVVFVKGEGIVDVCRYLHDSDDLAYEYLSDITAVDLLESEPRMQVVYHLYSFKNNDWLRLKVPVYSDDLQVPSVTDIWRGANWLEREVYDMFGITFAGHPDLRRILMPDDWDGHPLAKDYPLLGHKEETVLLFENATDVLE